MSKSFCVLEDGTKQVSQWHFSGAVATNPGEVPMMFAALQKNLKGLISTSV